MIRCLCCGNGAEENQICPTTLVLNFTCVSGQSHVLFQSLAELAASKAPLREAWAAWNPQRAAAQQLQEVAAGTITLEVGG